MRPEVEGLLGDLLNVAARTGNDEVVELRDALIRCSTCERICYLPKDCPMLPFVSPESAEPAIKPFRTKA